MNTHHHPLNFENTQEAFAYKSDRQLKKSRWLFRLMQHAWLVKWGSWLTPLAIHWKLPIRGLLKSTLFEQFVGGESLRETTPVIDQLGKYHVSAILDYGVEGSSSSDEHYDKERDTFISVIEHASTAKNISFISIKVTGLVATPILEKLNTSIGVHPQPIWQGGVKRAIANLSPEDKKAWEHLMGRMRSICSTAQSRQIAVMIDAEESWIQDGIDHVALSMMTEFNQGKAIVYNTVQLYRSDRLEFLESMIEDAKKDRYILGVKLVRGAYMEKERKRAELMHYPSPIQINKESSDKDYDRAVARCMNEIERISIVIGSHNEASSRLAAELAMQKGLRPNDPHVHFSQLYGMSDHLTFNLAAAGFNASKYLPFGPIEEVIPYLMRRAQENSSVSGQTSRELELINKECSRRGI